jgi:metallophosphoesterase superfamily enzyme
LKDIQIIKDVFISDLYCVYLQDISAVVISDLHLGFEEEMNLHGLFLPKLQRNHVEKMVDQIIDRYSPSKIIINTNIKQNTSTNSPKAWHNVNHYINR